MFTDTQTDTQTSVQKRQKLYTPISFVYRPGGIISGRGNNLFPQKNVPDAGEISGPLA